MDIDDDDESRKEEFHRFEILRGEVLAGNDAPQILSELKKLLLKFIAEGSIPKQQGHSLLYEISCLG